MRKVLGITAGVALATFGYVSLAHAEPRVGAVDWGRAVTEIDALARGRTEEGQTPNLPWSERNDRTSQLFMNAAGAAWVGVAPRVSLVARDWGEAYRLAGDRLSLVDEMRLSSSTRMVLSRVRLSSISRVTPFAQIGIGQWRTDTNLLPFSPRTTEVAAQVGGGFEMRLAPQWQIACEVGTIQFIRDNREAGDIPAPRMWSATLASRVEW